MEVQICVGGLKLLDLLLSQFASPPARTLCPIQEKLVKLVSWWPLLRRREFKIVHYGRLGRLDASTGGLGP